MNTEIKRPNYFTAQFLVAADFQDEQAYHNNLRQQHLLALHGWGVVGDGLRVTRTTGSDRSLTISPGVAVNNQGQEIILTSARTISLPDGDGPFILSIRYGEFQAESDRYTGPGADAIDTYTRTTETPSFAFGTPGNDDVPLARISFTQNPPIDESVRRYTSSWIAPGANLPGPMTINNVLNVTGRTNISENLAVGGNLEVQGNSTIGNADSDQITMRGILRSAHSSGALEVDDAVHTTGPLTVDANVGIGTNNPTQRLTIQGNYQATVDAKQLVIQGNNNLNNQLGIGYHTTGNYGAIQAIAQGVGSNLLFNPLGGNVGIGSTNPQAKLTLQTPNDFNGRITRFEVKREPDTYNLTLNAEDTTGVVRWIFNQTNAGNNYNSVLVFDRGNVGIGTNQPSQTLHVNGRIHVSNGVIQQGGNPITTTSDLGLYSQTASAWMRFVTNDAPIRFFTDGGIGSTIRCTIEPNGNVGIGTGTENPITRLHVVGGASGNGASPASHVAYINNTFGASANVLALRLGSVRDPSDSLDVNNNFITFFAGEIPVGAIEGGRDSVVLKSGGADYAEYLPRLSEDEVIEVGDIVGVFAGKITKTIAGAHHVMAITDKPIVLGNTPDKENQHLYEKVSFLGQVPIKVRGAVQLGDFIIPSGLNDGTGIAVSPKKITPIQYSLVVGRAWEDSTQEGVKRINTVVGLPSSYPQFSELLTMMQAQQVEITNLKAELNCIKSGDTVPSDRILKY